MKKTSMVFLTFNRLGTTIKCFQSLAHTLNRKNVEWLIIDNASNDNTANWLHHTFKDHKQVRLFLSTTNRGVAGGREFLFNHVSGDIIVSLDSDVLFKHGQVLDQLVSMVEPPDIGIAGVSGHFLLPDWSWYMPVYDQYVGEVDVVSGYCQVFRREMLAKAALDQYYNPYWHEDSDYCLQIKEAGYKVWCNNTIPIVHIFSGSGDDGSGREKQRYLAHKFKGKKLIAAENVPTTKGVGTDGVGTG